MATITLTGPMSEALLGHGDETELKNVDGSTVGFFVAPEAYNKLLYGYAERLMTDDEMQMSRSEIGGKTTQELLRHLGISKGE